MANRDYGSGREQDREYQGGQGQYQRGDDRGGQGAYGQPPYGQPPYGQPPYGQPQYGQPQYGQPGVPWNDPQAHGRFEAGNYTPPSSGQPYGQQPYGQPGYGQPGSGASGYGSQSSGMGGGMGGGTGGYYGGTGGMSGGGGMPSDRPPTARRLDLGDRNPSQGFTGGYGGAVGDDPYHYASAGDRIGQGRAASGGIGDSAYARGTGMQPSHAGRGPRNYRRSDQRIEEEVNEALTHHHEIDATDIEVRVEAAVVTLTGEVEDRRSRRLAEEIVEQVRGVVDVRNELHARRGLLSGLFGGEESHRSRADRDVTPGVQRDTGMTAGGTGASGTTGLSATPGTSGASTDSASTSGTSGRTSRT